MCLCLINVWTSHKSKSANVLPCQRQLKRWISALKNNERAIIPADVQQYRTRFEPEIIKDEWNRVSCWHSRPKTHIFCFREPFARIKCFHWAEGPAAFKASGRNLRLVQNYGPLISWGSRRFLSNASTGDNDSFLQCGTVSHIMWL